MEFVKNMIEIVLHIDQHLNVVIQNFGNWSYLLMFIIIFAETGLVITPFLPGDSLLFALGALAAMGSFNMLWLLITLACAAIIGDSVNYTIGKLFGERLFQNNGSKFFKKEYLDQTHKFYEKHGGKTIILARFIPIVRTFAPFVAGIGRMNYGWFFVYNVIGAILWVGLFVPAGYYFGNIPVVKENFFIVVIAIILFSVLPAAIEIWRHRKNNLKTQPAKKSFKNKIARFFHAAYLKLVRINDTPQKISIGFGLGVFLGVMPGMGPIAALFLAVLFRVNRAAALLGSVLTNTWLSIPVFLLAVKTGAMITGLNYSDLYNIWSEFLKDFHWIKLLQISVYSAIFPIIAGYVIVSFCVGLVAYGVILVLVKYMKKKSEKK